MPWCDERYVDNTSPQRADVTCRTCLDRADAWLRDYRERQKEGDTMPVLKATMKPAELRKFRTERRLTCQEIADTLGVSRSCYTHWERGEAPISLHAEAAIRNWKIMVKMGEAIIDLDDNGRAELAIMEMPTAIEAEIMRYKL